MTRRKTAATDTPDWREISVHVKRGATSNISVKKKTRDKLITLRRLRADGRRESIDDIVLKLINAYERGG